MTTVVDFVRPAHLYSDFPEERIGGLYGLGFTYQGWLSVEDDQVDRSSIGDRVWAREFDLVIFGSVHRGMPYLEDVLEVYGKEDVVFVDGEDEHEVRERVCGEVC